MELEEGLANVGKNRVSGSRDWSDMARPEDAVSHRNVVPKSGSASDSSICRLESKHKLPTLSP